MAVYLSWLWPFLLGGLIGWLLATRLSRGPVAAPDNAKDEEISRLRGELESLRRRPALLQAPMETAADNVADPRNLVAMVGALEDDAATIAELRRQIEVLQAAPTTTGEPTQSASPALQADGGPEIIRLRERCAELEQTVKDQARSLTARDQEIRILRQDPAIDIQAARLAGFAALRGAEDLEIIKGITAPAAELLRNQGIGTFAELGRSTPAQLLALLERAGLHYSASHLETWPEQAVLAGRNLWSALKLLQVGLADGPREHQGEQAA